MLLRFTFLAIVLFASVFTGHSQKVSEYKFSVLNSTNGFAGNFTLDILQDHNGFMWFASDGGLQRYDGKRFMTFRNKPGDLTSIPDNTVESLHEDKKHNLWIITEDDRVGIFNTSYFTYSEIPVREQKKEGFLGIKHMVEDNQENLHLIIEGQDKPFFIYSEKEKAFIHSELNEAMPAKWVLDDFFYDKRTHLFWLASDSGLVKYDPVRHQSSYRGHNVSNDPVINRLANERFVTVPYVDIQKNFWCVSVADIWDPPQIHRIDAASLQHEIIVPFKDIRKNFRQIKTFFSQKNGRLWVCGIPFLMEYKRGQTPLFDTITVNDNCNPKSLTFNAAVTMYEDRDHTLWIGTTHGVVRFSPDANLFSNYLFKKDAGSTPIALAASGVIERKNGEIWVGTIEKGLYTLNQNFEPVTPKGNPAAKFTDKAVYSLHEHSQTGLIWMGYALHKLAVYDPATGQSEILNPPILENHRVFEIQEDKNGNLWFVALRAGGGAKLIKWDKKLAGDDFRKGLIVVKESHYISGLLVDNKNAVWVNLSKEGLNKFDAETNQALAQIKPGHNDRSVVEWANEYLHVIQYNDSLLVAVGGVITLINTNNNTTTHIGKTDGLPGIVISVLKDKNGILWGSLHDGGLCRINLARKVFTVYNKDDGIYDDFFRNGPSTTLRDGRLVFNSSMCVVAFNPADMVRMPSAPPAHITDFRLLNISLPVDSLQALSRVHLPYDKNSLTIEFSALSFTSQNKVNYYYQMEGLEKEWVAADETQRAVYNYLPAGKYTFRIRTDNGASGNSAVTAIQLTVHAPFWKTYWFWSLIALVVASVLFLLDRERVKRLVSLQKMRTEIAVNLHKDVTSTLNNINLLSEMARIKADKDLDRSKEYIQQISDKSNRMIVAMDDILWSIEPENDSMERSLLRMREFIDALKNRYNAEIVLIADKHLGHVSMDMKKRHEFFLIFKEALRCVVQLAEGRDTMIHLDTSKNKLVLKLQDATADPYNQQQAVDESIRDIENRSAQIKAECDIEYDQKGIAMIIQLPLI